MRVIVCAFLALMMSGLPSMAQTGTLLPANPRDRAALQKLRYAAPQVRKPAAFPQQPMDAKKEVQAAVDPTKEAAATAAPQNPAPPELISFPPLVSIRFDRRHVYFEKKLRQAIAPVEARESGAFYEVVSLSPIGTQRAQNMRINEQAGDRLAEVLDAMNQLGIGPSRIGVRTESSDMLTAQEIQIFLAN